MRISDWSSDVCSSDLWLGADVLWKLCAGCGVGWLVGRGFGWLVFHLPNRARLSRTGDGFVAIGMTFLSYGLAEAAAGYGFVAVFVTAVAFRSAERSHAYHDHLHDRSEEHTSELQSLMRISDAVFCLKNKKRKHTL